MTTRPVPAALAWLAFLGYSQALLNNPVLAQSRNQAIEPGAANWKTWVLSSGHEFRVPPPPDAAATQRELAWVKDVTALQDPRIADQVQFWDAGSPGYRWIENLIDRSLSETLGTVSGQRLYPYVAIAIYDATIAAWDSKYAYNRPRPAVADPTLPTRLATPNSPSYPSEHAAVAAAAAGVIAYFFPREADSLNAMAEEAARSRLYAGLQYPSDYFAGLELGRKVAARVIERAKADNSDAVWTGAVPVGPGLWIGTNPGNVTATNWKTFVLSSANEFRPPVPPAYNSPQMIAETAEVRTFPRTFNSNQKAFFWQSPEGRETLFWNYANKRLYETKLDQNPPRAARAYALLGVSIFDTFTASQDGKFTYWYIRPHQLDSGITPLFPAPNFPGYPSNHSSLSTARCEVLAYLFPREAASIRAVGKEAGDSRIWAGIHFQIDNVAGVNLGNAVARKVITWAENDGSKP
ncbi:MAG TPA: vanadium-dependent haloperoxidase [Bryobacteraceae bacterium]|nr:vanadium-dependent haloperoxidase [Bryobacteraceae bacterium]